MRHSYFQHSDKMVEVKYGVDGVCWPFLNCNHDLFMIHDKILLPCQNLVPTLPTNLFDWCQRGHRLGAVMLVGLMQPSAASPEQRLGAGYSDVLFSPLSNPTHLIFFRFQPHSFQTTDTDSGNITEGNLSDFAQLLLESQSASCSLFSLRPHSQAQYIWYVQIVEFSRAKDLQGSFH